MKRLLAVAAAALGALGVVPPAHAVPPLLDGCTYSVWGPDIESTGIVGPGYSIAGSAGTSSACSRPVLGCALTVNGPFVEVVPVDDGFTVAPPSAGNECEDTR